MNFYSDRIVNDIIDNKPLDQVIDLIEEFGEKTFNTIVKYSIQNIHHKYTYNVLGNRKNIIAFYCLDREFALENCPSILIYRKCKCKCGNINEIRYYILLVCTKRTFRNQGYASKLLDGLIERIKEENSTTECTIKIILNAVEESVIFYETYGFKWTRECITNHYMLLKFELYEPEKEYFIMEFIVA